MSSSSFNVIRRHGSKATNIRIKELTQELARQRSATSGLETDAVRSQGRMDHSTIKVNDERLKFITRLAGSDNDFTYEFPTEPDFNYLKVWFMLDHLGARMRDMSGFGNDAYISGHPTLRRVGLDLGFQQTSAGGGTGATPVMLFNSGTDVVSKRNGEYVWIPDNPSIKFTQFTAGFSIAFRFNCLNFNPHHPPEGGSYSRRFAAKTDDASNGWSLIVYPTNAQGTTGGVEFEIKDGGTNYAKSTAGYSVNLWYQVVVTYNRNASASERIKIYTAGTEDSSTTTFGTLLPTHTNLRIGARDFETGFFFGYIHDFRLYMGKVLTQTEITNINQNEMSIDDITKGHVFIVQYAIVTTLRRVTTHRFSVGGFTTRNRVHKFNIVQRLTRSRTHKFNVLDSITRSRTHKYNVLDQITRSRIHRYSMGGVLRVTKTQKYNIIQKITKSKTHRYNMGGLQTQYLRFQKSATAGSNITQDVTFTAKPQAIIVWSDGTTSDNTFNNGYQLYYGFSDGTNNACVSSFAADNVTTTDAFSGHKTDKVISMMNATINTVASEATVSFIDTNTARFTWSTNDNRAVYIHCLALWGVTAAEVKTFTTGQTTTGNRTYSLTNSLLVPKLLHTIQVGTTAGWSAANGNAITIGAGTSSSKQWSVGNTTEDARTTSSTVYARSYYDETNVLVTLDDDAGEIVEAAASLVSLGTGDFVLNWNNAPVSSTVVFSALCIDANDAIDADTFIEPAATGVQNVTVASTVNTVKGLMLFNNGQATSGVQTDVYMSIGGASGTETQGLVSVGDDDQGAATRSARINKTGSIVKVIFPTATATSSTTSCEASLSSVATPDQFSLNWSVRSGSRRNHYIAFGGSETITLNSISTTPSKTHKYNVIGKVVNTKTHKYDVSQAEGTVSKTTTHKYHVEGKISVIQTHKYNVIESITLSKTHKYNILNALSTSKTHKYDVVGKVSVAKTHKYDIEATAPSYTEIYNENGTSILYLYSGYYLRAGIKVIADSALIGEIPNRVTVYLSKGGNPSGTISVTIRNASDTLVTIMGTLDASTVSVTKTAYTVTNDDNTHALQVGDRILVEYTGASNIRVYHTATGTNANTDFSYYYTSGAYSDYTNREWAAIVYS